MPHSAGSGERKPVRDRPSSRLIRPSPSSAPAYSVAIEPDAGSVAVVAARDQRPDSARTAPQAKASAAAPPIATPRPAPSDTKPITGG